MLASDVREARERLGTVSVELPVRWLGGQLQTWEQLEALKRTCRERGVKLHMDGARLWESQPFYGRSYADIVPGVVETELQVGPELADIRDADAARAFSRLLTPA